MVGDKVFDAYWPDALYNHDACDPDGMVTLGNDARTARSSRPTSAPPRATSSSTSTSTSCRWTAATSRSASACAATSRSRRTTRRRRSSSPNSFMDPAKSYLSHSVQAHRARRRDEHMKVFHIETALNNRMFDGPLSFLMKNEDDFTETDRLKFQAMKWTLDKLPSRAAPRGLHARAGAVRAHRRARRRLPSRCTTRVLAKQLRAVLRPRRGPGRYPDHRASRTSRPTTSTPRRSIRCSCR